MFAIYMLFCAIVGNRIGNLIVGRKLSQVEDTDVFMVIIIWAICMLILPTPT